MAATFPAAGGTSAPLAKLAGWRHLILYGPKELPINTYIYTYIYILCNEYKYMFMCVYIYMDVYIGTDTWVHIHINIYRYTYSCVYIIHTCVQRDRHIDIHVYK